VEVPAVVEDVVDADVADVAVVEDVDVDETKDVGMKWVEHTVFERIVAVVACNVVVERSVEIVAIVQAGVVFARKHNVSRADDKENIGRGWSGKPPELQERSEFELG
jgi:hypothetical protein